MEKKLKVELLKEHPAILAAVAAKVSRAPLDEGSIKDIFEKTKKEPEKAKKLVGRVLNYGHMIPADFGGFAIALENISRLAAVYIWRNVNTQNFVFGAGIEASLRLVKANRYKETIDDDLGSEIFEAYEKLLDLDIPTQDARYVLPEATLTRMVFSAPPRYLIKLANSLIKTPLQELQKIGKRIKNLVGNYFLEIPEEPQISQWKFWGKEKDTKSKIDLDFQNSIHSLSLNMDVEGSLSMYAQLVRQRQLLCSINSLESIVGDAKFSIPPTFNKKAEEIYKGIAKKILEKQKELVKEKDPNFAYWLLLGQRAKAKIFGKGIGVLNTSRARSEGVAQWEIRKEVGIKLTRELIKKYPQFKEKVGPHCWRKGFCKEDGTFKTKEATCPAFKKWGGKKPSSLKECLDTLEEKYEIFNL